MDPEWFSLVRRNEVYETGYFCIIDSVSLARQEKDLNHHGVILGSYVNQFQPFPSYDSLKPKTFLTVMIKMCFPSVIRWAIAGFSLQV